jgi:hypothetical protein
MKSTPGVFFDGFVIGAQHKPACARLVKLAQHIGWNMSQRRDRFEARVWL